MSLLGIVAMGSYARGARWEPEKDAWLYTQCVGWVKRDIGMATMKRILKECGIRMSVGACGCCDSPWVRFEYKGVEVLPNSEDCNFDTFEEDNE